MYSSIFDGGDPGTLALAAAVFFLGGAPAAAQEAPARVTVTLEEATAMALENNPQIVQAVGATRNAAAAERTAFGAYLPRLNASMGSSRSSSQRYDPNTNRTVSGASESYSSGISASWDVFTAGRRGADRAAAAAESESAEAQLVEQNFSVALSVEQAFFDEIRGRELLQVAESQVERAEQGLDAAERRASVGSATRSDVLRAELELNQARQAVLNAQTQQNTASYALGRLIGVDGAAEADPTAQVEVRPLALSADELVQLLAGEAPTMVAAAAAVRSADAGVTSARTQYYPSVSVSSGYDWSNQQFAFSEGRTGWNVRLGLSYPIFNGFQREASVERARVQQQIAAAQLADTRRQIRAEVERLLGQLRLAEQSIALSEQAVEAAREDLRVQQQRYDQGMSTMLELLTSQEALVQAENDLVGTRFDYQIARAQLESLAGREL